MIADAMTTIEEWPSEKKKPTESGRLPLLHQLAHDIVDRRDVVGVEGVAQPEHIGEEGGAEQDGFAAEFGKSPGPGGEIAEQQKCVDGDQPRAQSPRVCRRRDWGVPLPTSNLDRACAIDFAGIG